MTKIVLLCALGMSTSMVMRRMKQAASEMDGDFEISAHSLEEARIYADDADVLMLAPQVRYALGKVKEQFPRKAVTCIEMRDYGTMNGRAILEAAEKALAKSGK